MFLWHKYFVLELKSNTHYNTIFSNVNIISNLCCIYNGVLSNENMISNVKGKESNTVGK